MSTPLGWSSTKCLLDVPPLERRNVGTRKSYCASWMVKDQESRKKPGILALVEGRGNWSKSAGIKTERNDLRWKRYRNISNTWKELHQLFPPDPQYQSVRQRHRLPPNPIVALEIMVGDFFSLRLTEQTSPRTTLAARLFVPAPQTGTSIVLQARLAADLMSGGNIHSSLSVPNVQLVPTKPSLFMRIRARIMGRRQPLLLGAPESSRT